MKKQKFEKATFSIRKAAAVTLAVYTVLIIAFFFLAGDQLHLRASHGNIDLQTAETGAAELVQGMVIEQRFVPQIQRLETVSVQWGTSYRTNTGTVRMELVDTRDGSVRISQTFDVATIAEGAVLSMSAEEPIETLYDVPLILRLSADSVPGSAVTPLMVTSVQVDDQSLSFNGQSVPGTLCFAVTGEDYIWTGLHYWKLAAIGAVLLTLFWLIVDWRQKEQHHSYVMNAITAVQKYRFLIRQLVSRDFKTKYKRSVLGIFWSFLNPLLTMIVQYFIFSTIFKSDIPNYPAYLLIGIVAFNFFSEACGMSLTSILGNASLITKVYMPKYIYPLTRVMSSVVNFAISLIPLVLVSLITGVQFQKSAILSLFFFTCIIIFSLGLGLLLSASMVFFRDTQFLWGVLNMIWMYATPIFYPESILPDKFKVILHVNPMYHFLKNARICILDGISPEPAVYVQCMVIALIMLTIGAAIFRKYQNRFVLYL